LDFLASAMMKKTEGDERTDAGEHVNRNLVGHTVEQPGNCKQEEGKSGDQQPKDHRLSYRQGMTTL